VTINETLARDGSLNSWCSDEQNNWFDRELE